MLIQVSGHDVKMPVAVICGAVFRGSEFKGLGIKGCAPNSKLFAVLGSLEWLVSTKGRT